MKYVFFILFLGLAFASPVVIPEISDNIVRASHVNRLYRALFGSVIPRNSGGVAEDLIGSLGTLSFPWNDFKLVENFNVRSQLGESNLLAEQTLISTSFNSTTYATVLSSSVSINTLGRPLIIFVGFNDAIGSTPSYVKIGSTAGSTQNFCEANYKITIDGVTIFENRLGWDRVAVSGASAGIPQYYPLSTIFTIFNDTLSNGSHSVDLQFFIGGSGAAGCSIIFKNGMFRIVEI